MRETTAYMTPRSVRREATLDAAISARTFPGWRLTADVDIYRRLYEPFPLLVDSGIPLTALLVLTSHHRLTENYLGFISSLTTPLNPRNLIWIIHDSAENTNPCNARVRAVRLECIYQIRRIYKQHDVYLSTFLFAPWDNAFFLILLSLRSSFFF